ncbi:Kelch repeat-containing protein [Streptomyces sp. NPDC001002]
MSRPALLTGGGEPLAASAAPAGTWSPAGTLPTGMRWYGQDEGPQLLKDGRVLVAGGTNVDFASVADTALYDAAAGTWSAAGPLATARRMHSLTALLDGRALAVGGVTGGQSFPGPGLASAELFDPESGTWSPAGPMTYPRTGHSATLLLDGRVLVTGGQHVRSARSELTLTTAELFDPETGTWTTTGAMNDARWHHQAVLLGDGRVLAIGGLADIGYANTTALALCEVYDPVAGTWSPAATTSAPRFAHQAVRLLDGSVLTVGGGSARLADDGTFDPYSMASAERYDPGADRWSAEPGMPWGRSYHRGVLLRSGDYLVIAGADDANLDVGFRNAVRYDPVTRRWTPTGGMVSGRYAFGATALADGRAIAVGGTSRMGYSCAVLGHDEYVPTAEVYTP